MGIIKKIFSDGHKMRSEKLYTVSPEWITTVYVYRLQPFMACSAECLTVMLNAFHDLFLATSGTSFP